MKILVVAHGFPPAAQGGSEIYAHAHAAALQSQFGDEVLVLTREADRTRADYDVRTERRDGLHITWVNNTFRKTRTFEETYRNEAIGAIADRVIDAFKPDVAHLHHLTALSTTIVRSLSARGVPCFVTLHDYWFICHRGQLLDVDYRLCAGPEPSGCHACLGQAGGVGRVGFLGAGAWRAAERILPEMARQRVRRVAETAASVVWSRSEADDQARRRLEHMSEVCGDVRHFLAPSRHIRDRFVQFGISPDRITHSPYGFDRSPFAGISRTASSRLRLGFLGSLMISKAPHVLLEAAARLPRGAVSVDLFGAHTPYHGDDGYRQQIEPLLWQDGVRMHGTIPRDRVAHALSSIDVLVVPSIWPENSPLVIGEAFLAGVLVVASRIGGIPEIVEDGRSGLLFRAGDSADLCRVLGRLLDEPALIETLRAGIPPVRTIEDDVQATRRLYQMRQPAQIMSRRLAAVVLNYRTPDDTLLAIRSLLASRRPIDDIVVVDNGAANNGDGRFLESVRDKVVYLRTGRNLGFSGGVNVGIREALARGADAVLLVNSDVIVPPDCVEALERGIAAERHAGIVGPVILSRSEPDRVASFGMSFDPITGRMRHPGAGSRIPLGPLPAARKVDGVSGCAMLVRRDVFEAIGLLDEDYFFSFEDLDFCLKARRHGFATILAGDAVVYHQGSRSIGADSPRRLYFAARNHLLLAALADPGRGRVVGLLRASSIVALNLAHAFRARGGSLPARLGAVAKGTRDYVAGRFGAG